MTQGTDSLRRPQGERRARFAHGASIEATRPERAEIAALAALLPRGTAVYLSAVARQTAAEQIAAAAALAAAGLEPVPHLAARRQASTTALRDFLVGCREAGVHRLLLVGGDNDAAAGPFESALDVVETGLLARCGMEEIGVAGYPDGHPRIARLRLDAALAAKLAAAAREGLRVHIVTQFCFDPVRIIGWLADLRERGIDVSVKVGMVGPTSVATLMRYARRCGVAASARGLMRWGGALSGLVGEASPQAIIDALIYAPAQIGDIAPHFFSFGGAVKTAQFARATADRLLAGAADAAVAVARD